MIAVIMIDAAGTHTDRQMNIWMDRQTDRQIDKQKISLIGIGKQMERQTKMDRYINRQINKQLGR